MKLDSYLDRIGYKGLLQEHSFKILSELHFHHATSIPFENLDIQLGLPIRLDLESLQDKLVDRKRGGYCFEQNSLFLAILEELGYDVIACDARVRLGRSGIGPRTHMLLVVELDRRSYICDVGFGAELLHPVPIDGEAHQQFRWTYRVVEEGPLRVLQIKNSAGWFDLYAFVPQPCPPIDFELANWYTSTHPQSRFVQTLTVQKPTPAARYILRNRNFVIDRGDEAETTEIQTPNELLKILHEVFDLPFPADTRFRNPLFEL